MASTLNSVVGALRTDLLLETGSFAKGAKGAQQQADTLRGRLAKSFSRIPGLETLSGGLAGLKANLVGVTVGAATALAGLSVASINSARELENMSRIANATPEEFQKMAHGAEQFGVSQEKLGDILKDMNDRVGDFVSTGGGPMADFFERIAPKVGVTIDQFRQLSGPQALQLYVDSLEKANVNQADFTFFMEAIASDSTALLPLLRNGGKAAREYGERLEALGGVRSNQTVARLSAMKTTFNELTIVLKSVRDTLGGAFAPILSSIIAAFNSLMLRGSGLRLVLDGVAFAVRDAATAISSIVNIVSHLTKWIWDSLGALVQWGNQFSGAGNLIEQVWSRTLGRIGSMLSGLSGLLDALGGVGNTLTLLGELAGAVFSGMVASAGAIPPGLNAVWETVKVGFYTFVGSLVSRWQGFLSYIAGSLEGVPLMGDVYESLSRKAGGAADLAESFTKAAGDARAAASRYSADAAGVISEGFAKAGETLTKLTDAVTKGKAEADAAKPSLTALGAGVEALSKGGGGGTNKAAETIKKLREELARLTETMGMTAAQEKAWDAQRQAGVLSSSAQGQLIADIVAQTESLREQRSAVDSMKDAFGSAFSSIITGASSARDAMSNLFKTIANNLANKAINSLFNGLAGSGGGFLSKVAGWLGFGKNANGTSNWRGGLSMVGERGPELVNMPAGSKVYTNSQTRSMLSSANGNARIQIDLGPDLEARILDAAASQSVQITKSGIRQNNKGHAARTREFQSDPYRA